MKIAIDKEPKGLKEAMDELRDIQNQMSHNAQDIDVLLQLLERSEWLYQWCSVRLDKYEERLEQYDQILEQTRPLEIEAEE